MNETIIEAILEHGKKSPEKLAVAFKNNTLTWGQLCDAMRGFAKLLQTRYHIQAQDKVMLSGVSRPEYIVAYAAIQYLGAVSIPVDKNIKEANLLDLMEFIRPKLLLTDGVFKDEKIKKVSLRKAYTEAMELKVSPEELPYRKPEPEQVSEMLFTTGTTGRPKGTMLSYRNTLASTQNTWHGVGIEPSDIILIPLPLNHSVGMRVLRTILYTGAAVILQNGFTFAKELEINIEKFGCTGLVSVPASIEVVYRQMQDRFAAVLGQLRYIEFGAGSLSYDMKKKLTQILPKTKIVNTWGSTETGGAIFLNVTERPDKYTSLGKPIEGVSLKVVNAKGETVHARDIDTAGRMALKGDMQMMGYYNLPEETKETLVDGWLYTNDIVYTDDEGYVYMLGRADDIINVGGEKVSPIEVENIAQEFGQIRECACIGVPDPNGILGQVPVLYIVPENGTVDQEELIKFLSGQMEKFKLPQKFMYLEELPRNRMKKLNRKELYRLWEEAGDAQLMNEVIRNIYSRHSIRDFEEKEIPRAYLEMIVKAGIHAPSGHNMQTWRFTVIQDKQKITALKDTVKEAAERSGTYFYGFLNPDTVILISNDRRNKNTIQDSACAAENMQLAAWSYGIGSAWINALSSVSDDEKVRELLDFYGIPKNHIVWSCLVMGYPAGPAKPLAKKENVIAWV